MNKYHKRFLYGASIIVSAMITATLMTFVYDVCVSKLGHEERFQVIFGLGGSVLGFASFMFAFFIWTGSSEE